MLYIFEQTLWMDGCHPERNVTLVSQCGLAESETSPIGWSANVGLQAQGFDRSRSHDAFGIGCFHTSLSNDFQDLLAPIRTLEDFDGAKLYYSAAVAKGFQLTTDFQVIEPADVRNDTALVVGLRATLGL